MAGQQTRDPTGTLVDQERYVEDLVDVSIERVAVARRMEGDGGSENARDC